MLAWIFGLALSVGSVNAASSDCLNIKFDNWDSVCLGITKSGTKNFKINIDKINLSETPTLMCYLTLPDGHMYPLSGCRWSFTYAGSTTQAVLLSATYVDNNKDVFYNWLSTSINFKNWTWGSSSKTINSGEGTNNWKSSSKSSDEIQLSTNRKSPSTSQYVNLTISTDKKYTGRLYLTAKYRSSTSSSWSSISNTSSTYFTDYSDEWDDGYYRMTSSDDGEVTLKNLVKFRKNGYYRIYVRDTDWNESYIQFNVGDVDDDDDDSSSKVSGFSSSELSKIKTVYKNWNSMIAEMQRKYPSLKKDKFWITLSNNLYDDLKDVVDNKKVRDFDDYDDFQEAFDDWYEYTMRNI